MREAMKWSGISPVSAGSEDQRRRWRRSGTRTRRRYASRREPATCRCWRRGILGRSPCASACRSVAGRLRTSEASGPASSC